MKPVPIVCIYGAHRFRRRSWNKAVALELLDTERKHCFARSQWGAEVPHSHADSYSCMVGMVARFCSLFLLVLGIAFLASCCESLLRLLRFLRLLRSPRCAQSRNSVCQFVLQTCLISSNECFVPDTGTNGQGFQGLSSSLLEDHYLDI